MPSEVKPLAGSCVAAGSPSGELFVVAANSSNHSGDSGGVWALSCNESSCTASLVASADPALSQVTACAATGFDSGTQAVVAAASPQGLFAASVVPPGTIGGSSKSPSPSQLAKIKASADMSGGAVPDGNPVLAVAVSAGWSGSDGDDLGIAIACATHDHLYYASSTGSPTQALQQKDNSAGSHQGSSGGSSGGEDGLVWRKEWVSVPQVGGVVDWAPPRYGLTFEPFTSSSSSSSAAVPPRLWIGTGKCLQVLDLSLGNMRRLDGPSQGLPYENITAVAFGSPLPTTSSSRGHPLLPLATNNELWLGTSIGAVRRTASLQPGADATSDAAGTEWRYLNGARWLPGANGHVHQLVAARSSSSSSDGKKNGGREGGKDGPGATTCYGCGDGCGQPAAGAVAITFEGLAVWAPQCTTLSAKATAFEEAIPTSRHTRYGLVADCTFTSGNGGGDPNANCTTSSSDNDGLWTSIYAASQIFKAATLAQEGQAYSSAFNASVAEAKEKFAALKKLFDVTGRPGCPARSYAKYVHACVLVLLEDILVLVEACSALQCILYLG